MQPLGIADEANNLVAQYGVEGAAERMPDSWLYELTVSGTPEQAAKSIAKLAEAGADSIILQPQGGDPGCLDGYIEYLMPVLK